MCHTKKVVAFIKDAGASDIPPDVMERALVCTVDLVSVALGGYGTRLSRLSRRFAIDQLQPATGQGRARILFDGTSASATGAAFANAAMIDSLDAHDGHAGPMGHAGVALLPALLAFCEHVQNPGGTDFLTALAVGYEIALRAGLAMTEYGALPLGSGAWNAIGCAAIGARLRRLNAEQTRHALGIADFNAPRSPIERSVAYPTMVKDGAGPGAAAGTSAVFLAEAGFTGAPCLPVEDDANRTIWETLGGHWEIRNLNYKPFPVIKWAEPAIMAALQACRDKDVSAQEVERVDVHTFASAARIDLPQPDTAEQAQYSLAFPLAVAIVHGTVRGDHLSGDGLRDLEVLRISRATRIHHDPAYDEAYPAEQTSRVTLRLRGGRVVDSRPYTMLGAQAPLTLDQALGKLRSFGAAVVSEDHLNALGVCLRSLPAAKRLNLDTLYERP